MTTAPKGATAIQYHAHASVRHYAHHYTHYPRHYGTAYGRNPVAAVVVGPVFFGPVFFGGEEGGLAEEFLEEGGGDAVGALDDGLGVGQVQDQAALVEADQLAAGVGVGQGQLGGQVDAAGAGGQRGLQQPFFCLL